MLFPPHSGGPVKLDSGEAEIVLITTSAAPVLFIDEKVGGGSNTMTDYNYDSLGNAIGYVRGKYVHKLSGQAVGQLNATHVHNRSGAYIGELHKDMVVDKHLGNYGNIGNPGNLGNAENPGTPGNRGAANRSYPNVFYKLLS